MKRIEKTFNPFKVKKSTEKFTPEQELAMIEFGINYTENTTKTMASVYISKALRKNGLLRRRKKETPYVVNLCYNNHARG